MSRRTAVHAFLMTIIPMILLAGITMTAAPRVLALTSPTATTGTIAYVRNGIEIRLVEPDGSNDRSLWNVPPGTPAGFGINGLAWRPDGRALAFSSRHENVCSIWQSDIYLIRSDGRGLRRLTNGPACADLPTYPLGSVTVAIENDISDRSEFVVYMQGALAPQTIIIQPGAVANVTFPNVADVGGAQQLVVAISGSFRWFDPAVAPNVVAGSTVSAGKLTLQASAARRDFGAVLPTWSPDGSRIGFMFGGGVPWFVAADAGPLTTGSALLNDTVASNVVAWSPTGDDLLYDSYGGSSRLNRTVVGGGVGTELAQVTFLLGLDWLRDGSGLFASDNGALFENSNLYWLDFASNTLTPVTNFSSEYTGRLSPAPDGQSIAFIYSGQPGGAQPTELRLINRDGSGMQTLAMDANFPSWSWQTLPTLPPPTYLPFIVR